MGPVLFLLVLVAGCYCAPGTLFDIGGTLGYDSHINGTIGGHLKADRDGLSVNATGTSIIAGSWKPNLIAKGHAQVGEKIIAGDISVGADIDNSWQPGFQGEFGRNSKGEWLLGFVPQSQLNNKFLVTPNIRVKTGDDARKLAGLPLAPGSEIQNEATQQVQMNGALGPDASAFLYGSNPNAPYGSGASGSSGYMPKLNAAYSNVAPGVNGAPNSYAGYAPQYTQPQYSQPQYPQSQYAQLQYAQPQYAQLQYAQPQYPQPQYAQPQYAQPQYAQSQYAQPQYAQPQYAQPQYTQPQYAQPQYAQSENTQPQYARPQYAQPQYVQPQEAQPMDQSQIPKQLLEQEQQQQVKA